MLVATAGTLDNDSSKKEEEEGSISLLPLKIEEKQIKVEVPPTPQLLYPEHSSQYTSIDPNTCNWGEKAMVD